MTSIRKATAHDIDGIILLWKGLMDMHADFNPIFKTVPGFAEKIRPDIEQWLMDGTYTFFVAEEENEIAGFAKTNIIQRHAIFVQRKQGHIGETFISQEFRGKGIGRQLIDVVKIHFKENGADFMDLVVSDSNPDGAAFWEAQGFVTVNHFMVLQPE